MSHTQSRPHGESAALSMLNIDPVPWPDEACAKRFHLDQQVDDLDEATENLCAIGASEPDFQPGAGRWRVLLDPDGQPSCLSPRPSAVP